MCGGDNEGGGGGGGGDGGGGVVGDGGREVEREKVDSDEQGDEDCVNWDLRQGGGKVHGKVGFTGRS